MSAGLTIGLRRACDRAAGRWFPRLQEFCAVRSVAGDAEGMARAVSTVQAWLTEAGARVVLLPSVRAPAVYGELGEGPVTVLFYNHYDVVDEGPGWTLPAFAPRVRGKALYARGAADNKGNLAARLAALEAMRDAGLTLPARLKFLVEGEEEVGSPGLAGLVARHGRLLAADCCVWEGGYRDARGRPTIRLGMKGLLRVELRCRCLGADAHSKMAAVKKSAAWRLVWALAGLKGRDERVSVPGFYDAVTVPTADDLECLAGVEDEGAGVPPAELLPGIGPREVTRRLLFSPTLNVSALRAGAGGGTVMPAEASATLDIRLVPDQDPAEVERLLRGHLAADGFGDVEVALQAAARPCRTPPRSPVARAAREAAREVYGVEPAVYPLSPGSGPLHVVCGDRGLPAVAFGVGHDGSSTHGPDENIRLEDFRQGVAMVVCTLLKLASWGR
ncbi:MAG: M20/M25/M40 family metallo-hydrolase [Acetobacteraceae bacterium]|nr:M20/M25/M40 family metallo-hydrolase [Acetobacteraceae bacterium]